MWRALYKTKLVNAPQLFLTEAYFELRHLHELLTYHIIFSDGHEVQGRVSKHPSHFSSFRPDFTSDGVNMTPLLNSLQGFNDKSRRQESYESS